MLGLGLNRSLKRIAKQQAPSHTELSYLLNSGSAWLNTGITGQSGIKVEMKIMFPSAIATTYFFGSRVGAGNTCFNFVTTGGALRSDYNALTSATSAALSINTEYIIKKFDNRQYLNDVEFGSYAAATFNNNYNMHLYACNTAGTPRVDAVVIRVYYLKIWDANNVLLRDFIPVIKDSVYCLYDKVSGTYFYNQGTGSFTGA